MVREHCLELHQQCLCRSQIATVVCQFGDDLSLASKVVLAFSYVHLGLRKMPFQHGSIVKFFEVCVRFAALSFARNYCALSYGTAAIAYDGSTKIQRYHGGYPADNGGCTL